MNGGFISLLFIGDKELFYLMRISPIAKRYIKRNTIEIAVSQYLIHINPGKNS